VNPSRWTENGSVRLHYLDSGAGSADDSDAAPILFVPGITDVADDYLPILGDFGRRVIVIDLRGRGRSDAPADGYALADHSADIEAVISEVTSGPVHLMSFSRGTCYALAWACDHPDRVLSVAIGDYPAREIVFPDGSLDGFMAGTWRGTPVSERLAVTALTGIVRDAVGRQFWDELGAFEVPVLVVRGSQGGPLTEEDWAKYAASVPGVALLTFEDSPHDIFRPDRLRYPRLVAAQAQRADEVIR